MVLTGHADPVYAVAFHPSIEEMVATAGGDDVGGVWDLHTGERTHTLSGHTDTVNLVAFSADGQYLATGSLDATVRVWSAADKSFTLVNTLQGPGEDILWIGWHPKGNVLLAGSNDCTTWMWAVPKGKEMQCFAGHGGAVLCGGFTRDGKAVVTGSEDGTVKVWNPKTGAAKTTFAAKGGLTFHEGPVTCLNLGPDNKLLISGSVDCSVVLSNIVSGKVLHKFEGHADGVESVAMCNTMPYAASASLDGTVRILDLENCVERHVIQHKKGITVVRFHPQLPILCSGALDRTVQVVDAKSGTTLQTLTGHRNAVMDLVFSPSGHMVLTGSDDETARLFRLTSLSVDACEEDEV